MTLGISEAGDVFERAIQDTRNRFVARKDELVDRFDGLLDLLEAGENRIDVLNAIAAEAHKISGVGKMIGLQGLGDTARRVEELARLSAESAAPDEVLPALIGAVEELSDRLDALQTEMSA
jgi:chemotaxis protein histidine kinase CheA